MYTSQSLLTESLSIESLSTTIARGFYVPVIQFQGNSYPFDKEENLLDGLLRRNARAPYSCRAGVCHSCMLRVTAGCTTIEGHIEGQISLTPGQIKKGYILACQTVVTENLELTLPTRDEVPGIITDIASLSPTEVQIKVATRLPFEVTAGEYVTFICNEGFEASYPVTAINEELQTLECIITRSAGGNPFSVWIHSQAKTDDRLMVIKNG